MKALDHAGGNGASRTSRTWSISATTKAGRPEFLSLNPNGKIPAIIDPNGPDGKPLGLFESGAILIYLADKTGKLLPADAARRYETIQWVMFSDGRRRSDLRPGRFLPQIRRPRIEDKRPLQRYANESKRLLEASSTTGSTAANG